MESRTEESKKVFGVSFVVINWNGKSVLSNCLRSILALNYPVQELIVSDNGSVDGSILSAIIVAGVTTVLVGAPLFVLSDFLSVTVFKQPGLEPYLKWFTAALPVFTVFVLLVNAM